MKYAIRLTAVLLIALLLLPVLACRAASPTYLPLAEKQFAIVVKSQGNDYFRRITDGFCKVIQDQGGTPLVAEPAQATAVDQITIINELIAEDVDCIAIATNDASALAPALEKAIENSIEVLSFDSAAQPSSRALHINQADVRLISSALMDAASDIMGEGQIAIMSTTNQANNQNRWIDGMRSLLESGAYPGIMLVNIVYGEDEYDATYERTQFLIDTYPELSLIIAPTAAGIPAVAECIISNGLEDRIKVTGLGIPSQMAEYIGEGKVCPYMFLWDLDEVGKLTAHAAIALVDGSITGTVGETLSAENMEQYTVTEDHFGGSEIALQADPIRFDESNIDYWKDIY